MKYIQALVVFTLLVTNKRYRKKWNDTCSEISSINDAIEASLRKLDVKHNDGKPKLRVL